METLKHALGMVLVVLAAYFFLGIGKPKESVPSKPAEPPQLTAQELATMTGPAHDEESWFTLRQLMLATETGIFSVPPGARVDRFYRNGSLYVQYQGRMYPVHPDDLTSDAEEAAAIRPPMTMTASAVPSNAQTQTSSPTPLDPLKQVTWERDERLDALDAQITNLRDKIEYETNRHAAASTYRRDSMNRLVRRVSTRNITIQRLQKQVSELEARKAALIRRGR